MSGVVVIDADETRAALGFDRLIGAVRDAFASGAQIPLRHHHAMPQPDGTTAVLLLMPAWQDQGYLGVKIVGIYPGNNRRGLPGVYSTYLLSDAGTGRPLALIDGDQITARRTAAVAALAASYLALPEASGLLVVGAGRVASLIAPAMREVRSIRAVTVWDIDPAKAHALADGLREQGFQAHVAAELEQAARKADIISCATLSTEPLIRGDWLKPGAHLDLIGSFTPQMREADDAAMAHGRVFVDSRDALTESGDLIGPLRSGALADISGTMADLCCGAADGRRSAGEITVFKAVGTALSDIAAAALVYRTPAGEAA
ncbi:MAG TPA: ornithine cyclodeaminase family protein [Caulobacteraceae bacterium]|jgi:ornithine cyclodeaminase